MDSSRPKRPSLLDCDVTICPLGWVTVKWSITNNFEITERYHIDSPKRVSWMMAPKGGF